MNDASETQVIGRDGFRGTLLDPVPPLGSSGQVRIRLDTGSVIEIPASMLQGHSPGVYQIPIGPADLERGQQALRRPETDEVIVPVLAEELHVAKEEAPTGGIRVHRRVQEHEETVEMPLLKESVDVRRVLINREVNGPMPVRRDGDTTIVPIVEEVLVVSKQFVLKEEIHITRTRREERHIERIPVKRQEAEIERLDASGRAIPPDPPTAREERRERRPRRKSIIGGN